MKEQMTTKELANSFLDRFIKLLSGDIIPGRNECFEPYDSEWERDFEWVLSKHLPDFVTLKNQVRFGPFRADYAFECSKTGRVWVVEFDGKTFHDAKRDASRDDLIFNHNPQVERIVRIDALTGRLEPLETQAMLSQLLPECFSVNYDLRYEWNCVGGTYISRVFDSRHDQDEWLGEDGILPNAPMISLKIQIKVKK
jgi:hypothetical protein